MLRRAINTTDAPSPPPPSLFLSSSPWPTPPLPRPLWPTPPSTPLACSHCPPLRFLPPPSPIVLLSLFCFAHFLLPHPSPPSPYAPLDAAHSVALPRPPFPPHPAPLPHCCNTMRTPPSLPSPRLLFPSAVFPSHRPARRPPSRPAARGHFLCLFSSSPPLYCPYQPTVRSDTPYSDTKNTISKKNTRSDFFDVSTPAPGPTQLKRLHGYVHKLKASGFKIEE